MVKHVHRDCCDHHDLFVEVLEDEDHVEVLQVELNSFEMHQLDIFQRDNKRGLPRQDHQRPIGDQLLPNTYPCREVDETGASRLEQHCLSEWHSVESQLSKRHFEFKVPLRY